MHSERVVNLAVLYNTNDQREIVQLLTRLGHGRLDTYLASTPGGSSYTKPNGQYQQVTTDWLYGRMSSAKLFELESVTPAWSLTYTKREQSDVTN